MAYLPVNVPARSLALIVAKPFTVRLFPSGSGSPMASETFHAVCEAENDAEKLRTVMLGAPGKEPVATDGFEPDCTKATVYVRFNRFAGTAGTSKHVPGPMDSV